MTPAPPMAPTPVSIDYAELAQQLRALGQENRLRLLSMLRNPRPIGDLLLTPGPGRAGERPERPMARQSVLDHLHQLQEMGLVRAQKAERTRSTQLEYVAVRTQLFALMESLREVLEAQRPTQAGALETVAASPWTRSQSTMKGPRIVLVHGAEPGRTFPLRLDDQPDGRGWVIGRKTTCNVSLDYDPFVSSESAEILHDSQGYRLLDLRTARNGTWLNWSRIALGDTVPLETGDVIGVGRSLLVFRSL